MKQTPPQCLAVAPVSFLTDSLGLYLHIPFCKQKCRYCDFYSFAADEAAMDKYTDRLCKELSLWAHRNTPPVTSVYFGGGTPTLLGAARLIRLLDAAARAFSFADPEITLEANPADDLKALLREVAAAGVNRLSIGMQSGVEAELRTLGRRHTNADLRRTVADARAAGISNLSLDLMLGLPGQNHESLEESLSLLREMNPEHVSAYLLKIEDGTPFATMRDRLDLPEEAEVCELYLDAAQMLESFGYRQYEISNFAKPGRESRHNLKYWTGAPYLGFGPAAHSFYEGKRFYYPRDFASFCENPRPIADGMGGGAEEYIMLRLRLTAGFCFADFERRFGPLPDRVRKRAEAFAKHGLCVIDETHISLTRQGFLVSNSLIAELLAQL